MGALTLKSFPYELRGWDIEKFESIDPTDGFGLSTKVYISKQQIVQIEPNYNENNSKTWLSDKGRQFFDGIFSLNELENSQTNELALKKQSWYNMLKTLFKNLYLFEHCNNKSKKPYFFTIVFENLSLEVLSLLIIIAQNYSFVKLRRAEKTQLNNDFESNYQLNALNNKINLNSSTLCLLVANNPRYEGYYLNLDLRQRYLKGNFKCFNIGSLIDLTFSTDFLGTNVKNLKSIAEGNNLICQDIKSAKNPLLVFSNELYKRTDGKNINEILKMLKYSNLFNKTWNGLNTLNPSLSETGIQSISNFLPLSSNDLTQFGSFYLINVNTQNVINLKKVAKIQLLNYSFLNKIYKKEPKVQKLVLDQNSQIKNNIQFYENSLKSTDFSKYLYFPSKMFYENEETFINTEGLIKKTTKLISRKKTKDNWKLLRNLLKRSKTNITSLNNMNNDIIFFNSNKQSNFKSFINFHYYAVKQLSNINLYLTTQNQPFFIYTQSNKFKTKKLKLKNTKLKYWLDDFFIGGKDEYSRNSLVLSNCSRILRTQSSNFF